MSESKDDIDKLIYAFEEIINNKNNYSKQYVINEMGDFEHKEFKFSSKDFFSLTGTIDRDITSI